MRPHVRLPRSAACVIAASMLTVAACGGSGPGGGGTESGGTMQVWAVENPTDNAVLKASVDSFNKSSNVKIEFSTYVNDTYKQKLPVSMGSPNAPDIFFSWGGGNLAQFVKAHQVADLTDALAKSSAASAFLPSVLNVGKIDGKLYALPMNGMGPVILYYNKAVFASVGLQPPTTYDQLLTVIDKIKAKGVIPVALAGSQGWTELMWLEYLLDRVGGPDVFADIAAGKPNAWTDPAIKAALQMCQDLAKRGAFGTNFASINYDNEGASKLFATGKAAMHLMGGWEYASQASNNPDFVKAGNLGWSMFPSVASGKGDPKNVVGNPSNYFSVYASGKHTEQAVDFLVDTLASDAYVKALVDGGQVPAVKGVDAKLSGTANAEFAKFTYNLVEAAPSFTQSWDQALSPAAGTAVNTNLQKVFLSQMTPDQFIEVMSKTK
jgi:raffinose/stachyose/melibiose transport system substrate-binding protein/xylobiose transport system substrate-binding protein